nr:TylF/MycF/NovP-related O-methyltransferase [Roseospira visakhapatnamensis]
MTNQDQRINIYHLVSQVLRAGVPGAFVELGCFVGETAAMIQTINQDEGQPPRPMHLYDSFAVPFYLDRPVRAVLEENFRARHLPVPEVHAGAFDETLPDALPDTIAFAHIDCGFGGDPDDHARVVRRCLEHVYPRLASGAALLLMDYAAPEIWPCVDVNPGVRRAADPFFADRPETVRILYAGEAAQGVVFKV